jgi:hypothetical protein
MTGVREAFVTSLHHFWERQLNERMKVKKYEESDVFSFLKAEGISQGVRADHVKADGQCS